MLNGRIDSEKGGSVALFIKVMYTCSEVQDEVEGRPVEILQVKVRGEGSRWMSWWKPATGHQTRRRMWWRWTRPSVSNRLMLIEDFNDQDTWWEGNCRRSPANS